MQTPATGLLDFNTASPASESTTTRPAPPKREPYDSALLRSIRKRERDTLAHYYDAQGELRVRVNRPTLSRIGHLERAGLHDGSGLTAGGHEMAAEVNRALDRLTAGISYDRATIRARPIEPKFRHQGPPLKSAEEPAPCVVYKTEATPLANETGTVWWGNGHIVVPGPVPERYARPEIETVSVASLRQGISTHEKPPGPNTPRIVPVAFTEQNAFSNATQYVWLSDGSAVDSSHLAAIRHEHGPVGRLVFTPSTIDNEVRTSYCAWTLADRGGWCRLAIFAAEDKRETRYARDTAAKIDDWLEQLLASHADGKASDPYTR